MSKKKTWLFILLSFELAVILPLSLAFLPTTPQTHHIAVQARKFGYTPSRIVVNKGDAIVFSMSSADVPHGFLLDGYPLELINKQGVTFRKYKWKGYDGKTLTNWERVASTKFVATRAGKFTYRCTQTCGNLHPFMTGELIVRPNTPYYLAVSLSIWVVFAVLFLIRFNSPGRFKGFRRINVLTRFQGLNRLVKRRSFQFLVILPNVIIIYLFILSSLWGSPVGNHNVAIIFVWILWWFVLKAIIVPLGGRIWCMMCPLPAPGEWLSRKRLTTVRYFKKPFKRLHHRFTGLQLDWPKKLDNMWLQNVLFLIHISFGMILITRPVATAIVLLLILGLSVVLALIYRNRVFCHYLCPVGGFLGTYSMASMTEVRAIDPDVCKKHKEKNCLQGGPGGWACPWNQYVGKMDRNNYCGLCTECIKSCPKDNVGIFLRPFGSDRNLKGYDEMYNIIIMLVVSICFSITMLGPWGFIKDAANVTESGQLVPFLIYLGVIWTLALLVFPGIFSLTAKGANRLAGRPADHRTITLKLAYTLIPVGIFSWIAFSLPSVMVNYNYILSIISDPLGLGWNLFGTADYPFNPFHPEWLPLIQGVILLTGLYFGLSRGYLGIKGIVKDPSKSVRLMILPPLFALFVVNIFLKLYMG